MLMCRMEVAESSFVTNFTDEWGRFGFDGLKKSDVACRGRSQPRKTAAIIGNYNCR